MIASAVTDLPHPLSPTSPTTSPCAHADSETSSSTGTGPRGGREGDGEVPDLEEVGHRSRTRGSRRSRSPSPSRLKPTIVTPRATLADRARYGSVRSEHQAVADHAAPGGQGLLDADAEEAQRRLGHDDEADADRGPDDEGRHDVREDVPEQDGERPCPADDGRVDEQLGPERERERPRQPRDPRPPDDRERHDHGPRARPEHRRHHDRQDQLREREDDVRAPHEEGVDPAAEVAGDHAREGAHGQRQRKDRDRDQEGDPGADDEPAQHVAAERVPAQEMRPRGLGPDRQEVRVLVPVGRQPRRPEGRERDQDDQGSPEARVAAPLEAPPEIRSRALVESLERRDRRAGPAHVRPARPAPRRILGSMTP